MRCKPHLIVLLFFIGLAPGATAQPVELNKVEIGPSGEAYQKAIRLRRIDNDVLYFDPTRPSPPLDTRQALQREMSQERDLPDIGLTWRGAETIVWVVFTLILLGVVYLFVTFGGRMPVSFGRDPNDAATGPHDHTAMPRTHKAAPVGIEAILRMADRRLALVALCKSLLARAVAAEGVLLQDSWTDRDTLRHVPRDLPQRGALQALVYASEKVQFGGRDVTEDEFSEHVRRLQTLWTRGRT